MQPSDRSPDRLVLPVVLALSLAAHLALLTVPVTIPTPDVHPEREAVAVALLRPEVRPDASAETRPEELLQAPEPADLPSAPLATVPSRQTSPPPEPVEDLQPPDASGLRIQAIQSARESAARAEQAAPSTAIEFGSPPRLPSAPGWLNAYTGTVTASVDRWQGGDGSLHSRTVLASGQVVCASTRPPTMQEIFNPWMSAAVPMLRDCGRERPEPVDRNNPWLRAPSAGH